MWTYDAQSTAGIAHSNPGTNVNPNRAKRSRLSVHPSHPQILGRSGKHKGSGSFHSGDCTARLLSHRLAVNDPSDPKLEMCENDTQCSTGVGVTEKKHVEIVKSRKSSSSNASSESDGLKYLSGQKPLNTR